ncbi:GNAT family N-acetyltransferase [Fictibacillus halophilus]|uniref:GNAT family N-acetyltransferase n=1 Tax=Fictibacillus halophilus TaxID=1610490 RepID=UPI001CF9C41A|nr:GNAT family N-acetyltransferase [Fictibacillus halophilus]
MFVRKAEVQDSNTLSILAYSSKAYWGYDRDFLEKCIDDLKVSEEYIKNNPVYVMEDSTRVIAYYSFSLTNTKLDALFIDPSYIGKGVGKRLWMDILIKAKELELREFTLDSDPHAEGFYLKMGAQKVGYSKSTVFPDRELPLMKVTVS